MKNNYQVRLRILFLFTFIVFASVLGIAFVYQNLIKEAVVVPILYLMWVGDLLIKSFDQQCIWVLALTITLILSLSLYRQKEEPFDHFPSRMILRPPPSGRIHFWRRRVRTDSRAFYMRNFHLTELRRLVIQALAYREGSDSDRIKEQLQNEQLIVPDELRYLLGLDDQQVETGQSDVSFIRLRQIIDWITAQIAGETISTDPRLEQVAGYLENLLEVDDDIRNL